MVTDPFLMGVFYGFVPAMGFLYILLHEYQAFFSEKRVFRTFFVGMIAGVVITSLEQFISPGVLALLAAREPTVEAAPQLIIFALLLGLLEALVFAAVLNWRSFRGRRDTPFYGVAFGIGFGATNVLFLMGQIVAAFQSQFDELDLVNLILLTMLGLYFIGGILVHGALGAWIGQGTGVGPLAPKVVRATFVRGAYIVLFYGILLIDEPPYTSHALALVGIVAGVWLVARVILHLLDRVVPPEVLREMEIHNRRLARRVLRDVDEGRPPS